MRNWFTTYTPWLLVLAVFAAALALQVRTITAATSPEVAVRQALEARGERVAGDCGATVSPRDVGQVCFRLEDERGPVRAYLVGRTFSEFSRWIFVGQDGTSWGVVGERPLEFSSPSLEIPWPE